MDDFSLKLNEDLVRPPNFIEFFVELLVEVSLQSYSALHKLMDLFIVETQFIVVVFLVDSRLIPNAIQVIQLILKIRIFLLVLFEPRDQIFVLWRYYWVELMYLLSSMMYSWVYSTSALASGNIESLTKMMLL
jgi:hypothetical protein